MHGPFGTAIQCLQHVGIMLQPANTQKELPAATASQENHPFADWRLIATPHQSCKVELHLRPAGEAYAEGGRRKR